jgi:signal transduction histidine kinase
MNTNDKPCILVVDDTPENIDILFDALKSTYQIKAALNGPKALEIAYETPPDLIILDVVMPKMTGYEVCKQLKSNPKTANIPIIFLTSMDQVEDEEKGLSLGAVDYVQKPIKINIVKRRIETQVKLKQTMDQIACSNQEKLELLHILCHDLVNPIFAAKNWLELLPSIPALDKPRAIETCYKSLDGCLKIIEKVRRLRYLEDKHAVYQAESNPLYQMMNESLLIMEPKLLNKDIRVVTDIEPDIAVKVERSSFINSVLNNIMTNAIKFSHNSGVINIEAKKSKNDVKLTIQDHGIGIPDHLLPFIFDVTKSTSRLGTQNETGTGFGMPLIKKFVEYFNGTVEIQSKNQESHPSSHGTKLILNLKSG